LASAAEKSVDTTLRKHYKETLTMNFAFPGVPGFKLNRSHAAPVFPAKMQRQNLVRSVRAIPAILSAKS
jgi:hypothetical protein